MVADEYTPIKLTSKDYVKLRVRKRRRIPYDEIIALLQEGYDVFIPDMNRKTASYLRRVLSDKLGVEVVHFPSEFQGMNGYTFKIKLIDKILSMVGDENTDSDNS